MEDKPSIGTSLEKNATMTTTGKVLCPKEHCPVHFISPNATKCTTKLDKTTQNIDFVTDWDSAPDYIKYIISSNHQ